MVFLWLNIIPGMILVIVFLAIIIFDRKNFQLEIQNIKLIVLVALLIALNVAIEYVRKMFLNPILPSNIFQIKVGNFILILIPFFCGLSLAFLAGIAADFLGLILISNGTPALYFTLTSVTWCLLPFFLVKLFSYFYQSKWSIYFYLSLSYALTLLLISGLNPIILKYMYNSPKGWWFFYFSRIIKYPFSVALNSMLLIFVFRIFNNSVKLEIKSFKLKDNSLKAKIKKNKTELVNERSTNDD